MQRLSQLDLRWKNKKFGTPNSNLTIGGYGCTITSIANLTDNLDPLYLADKCQYAPLANLYWATVDFDLIKFDWRQNNGDINVIKSKISKDKKALICVIHQKSKITHWLAVINEMSNGFECIDPLNPKINTFIKNDKIIGSAFFNIKKSINIMSKPNYLIVNNKILEDFVKIHGEIFGDRINDYKHLESEIPGKAIRERFKVLILKIKDLQKENENLQRQLANTSIGDVEQTNRLNQRIQELENETSRLNEEIIDTIESKKLDIKKLEEKYQKEILKKELEFEKVEKELEAIKILKNGYDKDFDKLLDTEKIKIRNELEKEFKLKKPAGEPIWKRQLWDFFRNGSYIVGGFFALNTVQTLALEFLNNGDFSNEAINTFGASLIALLAGYIQSQQKANRKAKEWQDFENKQKDNN